MKGSSVTLSADYKLKAGLLSRDFDLVPREADALSNLLRTAVIRVEGGDLGKYYGDIFDLVVGSMRAIEPVATREEFVATAVGLLNGEYAPLLRDGSRLVEVGASNAEHDVQKTLEDAMKQFASRVRHLPEETETIRYDLCRLQGGDIGVLSDGSVFVRRSSAVATALQEVGGLWFDGSKVTQQAISDRGLPPCHGYPESPRAKDILESISAITSALSFLPAVGPVLSAVSGASSFISLLFGGSDKPSVKDALSAVTRIVQNELTRDQIREQLANVKTWAGILSQQHVGLENAGSDPNSFIHHDYMPALNNQANSSFSGSVLNSLTQLKSLWLQTDWSEMDLLEDILKAMVLTLSHALMIRRDRVLLCARMVASGHPQYTQALLNAYYSQYREAVYGDAFVNPGWLKGRIQEWMGKRRYGQNPADHYYDHGSDYYGIAFTHYYYYGGEWYWVEDHGRRDSEGRLPGEPWDFKSTRVFSETFYKRAYNCAKAHQQSIDAEIRTNLVPLIDRCNDMVTAFESLKLT